MEPGRALRQARRRAGLTQRTLARRAAVPQPMIARIEAGRVMPRVDTLDRLLRACGDKLAAIPRLDEGHDVDQIRSLLARSHAERIDDMASASRAIEEMHGKLRR